MENLFKLFIVTDKSGRSAKPYLFGYAHIKAHFPLEEEDENEQSLSEFIDECEIGDSWQTSSLEIKHIGLPAITSE